MFGELTLCIDWRQDKFARLGHYIGENPWRFIITCLVIGLIASCGIMLVEQEGRPEELWVRRPL